MRARTHSLVVALGAGVLACGWLFTTLASGQQQSLEPEVGHEKLLKLRAAAAARPISSPHVQAVLTTPEGRRQAIDTFWGDGLPTADKLELFDKFWLYADGKYAAFQGIIVDWAALRAR